jgi:hypothetical protein
MLIISLLLAAALSAPSRAAKSRVSCHAGTAIITQGALRVFGLPFRASAEGVFRGTSVYACLPGGAAVQLGAVGADQGTDSTTIDQLAFDGSRYLATRTTDDGEGGPGVTFGVADLRTARSGGFANGVGGFASPPTFRVLFGGALLTSDDGVRRVAFTNRSGSGSPIAATGTEVAVSGSTAYWTQRSDGTTTAQSLRIPGRVAAPENTIFGSIDGLPLPRSRCEQRTGQTIARTQLVRVFASGRSVFACRDDRGGVLLLGRHTEPDQLRIVGDRWLLTLLPHDPTGLAAVYDMKALAEVTAVPAAAGPISSWSLLPNGALAWIQRGVLYAQAATASAPTELASAGDAPTALASANHTVYWTTGDAPHRFAAN